MEAVINNLKNRIESEYVPYGKEWEKEVMKLNKKEIIGLFRAMKEGTKCPAAVKIDTIVEARDYLEGCVNDFLTYISDQDEFLEQMGEYTARLMPIFWINAIEKIKEDPSLLED